MAKKPQKKAKSKPAEDLSEMELLVARGRAAVETQMEALEEMIKTLADESEGSQRTWDKAVATTNSLAKSIAALSAEQRQLERHTRLRLDGLTAEDEDAIVREFLEEIPRGRRKAFLDLLQSLDSNNDLLSL